MTNGKTVKTKGSSMSDRNWSPNAILQKMKTEKERTTLANSIRKWFKMTAGHGMRGVVIVVFCGNEDVAAIKRLGYNTIWMTLVDNESQGFKFVPIDSTDSPLNDEEKSQIRDQVTEFISSGVDGAQPGVQQNYADPKLFLGKAKT